MALTEEQARADQLASQAVQLNDAGRTEVGRRRARRPQSLTVMAGGIQSTQRGHHSFSSKYQR